MSAEAWIHELDEPSGAFFDAFAARLQAPDGLRDALREALKTLIPALDWEAYQPHVPHGLLGVRAVLRLRPLLPEADFLRALATQLHMAAHEGRRGPAARAQVLAAKGGGSWRDLETFIDTRRPALAYAEAQGFGEVAEGDFQRLGSRVARDMANVGHKAVFADHGADLLAWLEHPKATGRRLLGLVAWLAATPEDTFWARRAAKRLGPEAAPVPAAPPALDAAGRGAFVREICDLGLVDLLDAVTARLRAGMGSGDLLAGLVAAAAEKQLDARRDLEGKTSWNVVYLATLARTGATDPQVWGQAAALVNLFPTDEPEGRIQAEPGLAADPIALREAILDAECARAMGHAAALAEAGRGEDALRGLAEAASRNDPAFNYAHQVLAVAAAADLLPNLPDAVQSVLLAALAKSLANGQGSGDLGRQADRALARRL